MLNLDAKLLSASDSLSLQGHQRDIGRCFARFLSEHLQYNLDICNRDITSSSSSSFMSPYLLGILLCWALSQQAAPWRISSNANALSVYCEQSDIRKLHL